MTKVAVMDDAELLRVYAEQGSDAAFEELVRRYIGLVHSSALRQTRRPELAEDVTQAVFIVLAKKAHRLGKMTRLAGWLYRTTRLAGAQAVRNELRRERRERLAITMAEPEAAGAADAVWEQAGPLLDDVLAKLSPRDREAVLLRFFQDVPLKEIGIRLGCTEDTAGKRVNRALEKLRASFSRRGVLLPASTLASVISAHSVQAAPGALTSSVCVVGAHKGASASESVLQLSKGIMKGMLLAKTRLAVGLAVGGVLLASSTGVWPQQSGSPDPNFKFSLPGSFGSVSSLAFQADGKILVAASFDSVIPFGGENLSYSGLARLNNDGSVDASFGRGVTNYNFKPVHETDIFAMALQKDGKILIGGYWVQPDALKHTNLARLNPDGTLDAAFNPGGGTDFNPGGAPTMTPTSLINKLAVQDDGKILVGGNFIRLAGASRSGFGRLNQDGTLDETFNPQGLRFLGLQQGGKILVLNTNSFEILRLNSDGSSDPAFAPIPSNKSPTFFPPYAVQTDGSLIGMIGPSDDPASAVVGRFLPSGMRDTHFTATFTKIETKTSPSIVTSLAVDGRGKILVVGRFDHVNGIERFDIARLNSDGSTDTAFDAGPRMANQVKAENVFVEPDGKILFSGYTKTNNINNYYLVRLMGDSPLQFTSLRQTLKGLFKASLELTQAGTIRIDTSFNLKEWTPFMTLTNSLNAATLEFPIQPFPDVGSAFYRAVRQ